jgi:hypothetical protein
MVIVDFDQYAHRLAFYCDEARLPMAAAAQAAQLSGNNKRSWFERPKGNLFTEHSRPTV